MYKHTIMYVSLFMVCKRFLNAFNKKSKTISSSIGGLKLNKSLRLYVKIIWIFKKIRNGAKTRSRNDKLRTAFYLYTSSCPGFSLSFVLEIVRGRHSAPKKNQVKGIQVLQWKIRTILRSKGLKCYRKRICTFRHW